jgi:hypothetical protein
MAGPLIKHLTPLSKHGQVVKHAGKGAKPFPPQPKPGPLTQGAPSMNNYAKATPLPTPPPPPMGAPPMGGGMGAPSIGAPPAGIGAGGSPGQDQGMV